MHMNDSMLETRGCAEGPVRMPGPASFVDNLWCSGDAWARRNRKTRTHVVRWLRINSTERRTIHVRGQPIVGVAGIFFRASCRIIGAREH
jgi:hypothetical protein